MVGYLTGHPGTNVEDLKPAAVVVALFASLSGLLLGYDVGIINGALVPISIYFELTRRQMEMLVGGLNLAALPGTLVGGMVADWYGRRMSIAIGALLFAVGNSAMTFANSYMAFMFGRCIAGLAVGMTLVIEPLYVAETSPARLRGMLSTNVEVSFNVGILVGYVCGWLFSELPEGQNWRVMMGVSLLAPIASLLGVVFILPESPRWLATQNRMEEAEDVLHGLVGPAEARSSARRLRQLAKSEGTPQMLWVEMVKDRGTRFLLLCGGGVAFFSQSTGVETITYYSSVILLKAGFDFEQTLLCTIFVGAVKVIAIFASGCAVDRFGRVPLLMISSIGMGLAMLTIALAFFQAWSAWAQVPAMLLFVTFFSIGYGPIVYTFNAEIYPKNCRSKGLSFGMGVGRLTSAMVSCTFLSLVAAAGYGGAFLVFTGMCLGSFVFVSTLVPETKGMPLEDAEEIRREHSL